MFLHPKKVRGTARVFRLSAWAQSPAMAAFVLSPAHSAPHQPWSQARGSASGSARGFGLRGALGCGVLSMALGGRVARQVARRAAKRPVNARDGKFIPQKGSWLFPSFDDDEIYEDLEDELPPKKSLEDSVYCVWVYPKKKAVETFKAWAEDELGDDEQKDLLLNLGNMEIQKGRAKNEREGKAVKTCKKMCKRHIMIICLKAPMTRALRRFQDGRHGRSATLMRRRSRASTSCPRASRTAWWWWKPLTGIGTTFST